MLVVVKIVVNGHFKAKEKALNQTIPCFFLAESQGFEPWNRSSRLHDFQSCAFDHSANSPWSTCCAVHNVIYYSYFPNTCQAFFRVSPESSFSFSILLSGRGCMYGKPLPVLLPGQICPLHVLAQHPVRNNKRACHHIQPCQA